MGPMTVPLPPSIDMRAMAMVICTRITSYNVCYTKLLRRRRRTGERRLATQYATTRILVEARTSEDAVPRILRAWDGWAGPTSTGAAVYHLFVERLTARLFEDRITSYNVCYTKLLRRRRPTTRAGSTTGNSARRPILRG